MIRTDFIRRLDLRSPIIQAPMVGPRAALAAAVTGAGGLGSLACATLSPDDVRTEVAAIRTVTGGPFNLNFFCHTSPEPDLARAAAWRSALQPYYAEYGLDPAAPVTAASRAPFDAVMRDTVLSLMPRVVSFHFGLPAPPLLEPLKTHGIVVLASATTVPEARWLEAHGADAIIAQGAEAGGHRGMFLTDDLATQAGTLALVPQIVDAVSLPVIAAGGIADGRGVAAVLALGASAAQVGTAYLLCPEAQITSAHRQALLHSSSDATALTNVLTGRPARGIVNRVMREQGPITASAPAFPGAAGGLPPLRASMAGDFSPLWSGQAAAIARPCRAAELTARLAQDATVVIARLQVPSDQP
jgi:nitronate monooxygenase